MQGFIFTANTAAKKLTLFLDSTKFSRLDTKFGQSQWSVKSRSRALGQGAFLKCVSRVITMQCFILPAITATE